MPANALDSTATHPDYFSGLPDWDWNTLSFDSMQPGEWAMDFGQLDFTTDM